MKFSKGRLLLAKDRTHGITLIALVITIIVLIILAGVSIAMLVGENGIITQAQRAKEETEEAEVNEKSTLDSYEDYINSTTGEVTGGEWNEEKGVNAPKLASNMKLVTFNLADNTWVEDITKNEYSYVDTSIAGNANKSEWANAEVTVDGITSYFVWIPRYAYKITYYTDENKTTESSTPTAYGTIDVKFIKGTGKTAADGITVCKYADDPTLDTKTDYIIHPAFTTNADLGGGWNKELAGIWIGKYEASLANKADGSNIVTDDEETGNILLSDNTDKTVVTKAGYSSWRNITIGNMYTNALAYSTKLKSHMLKNSEWGAVAYLTESKYGRNGANVSINNNGETYYTGGGAKNAYIVSTDQSSTGNIYGIYDLSGNAWERVASYYSEGKTEPLNYGKSFTSIKTSNAYVTIYEGADINANYKYGDATYETCGWHQGIAHFVQSGGPFFSYGGGIDIDVYPDMFNGMLAFTRFNGSTSALDSFRVALVL